MLLKDIINPKKWLDFAKYKFREWFGKLTPQEQAWQAEVIVYRGLRCPNCKANGKCVGVAEGETKPCGCDFIGKSTDMTLSCSLDAWGPVESEEEWELIKKSQNIKFKL